MRNIAVLFIVVFSLTAAAIAQNESRSDRAWRTVTNADLEPYQKERVAADKDYRANYAQKGMPSPEEIDRINQQRAADTQDLAERLRQTYLEADRAAAEMAFGRYAVDRMAQSQVQQAQIQAAAEAAAQQNAGYTYPVGDYYPGYYGGWGSYNRIPWWQRNRQNFPRFYPGNLGNGYYVSGGMTWPTGTISTPVSPWRR